MGQIIFQAMEEILGRNGVNAILNLASLTDLIDGLSRQQYNQTLSFDSISGLHSALESFYGPHGGRGLPCALVAPVSNMVCVSLGLCMA